MENEKSPETARSDTVRAEERDRLAQYLHDSIGQVLPLAKIKLTRIQHALREPYDADRQAWLQRTVDSLIPEIDTAMEAIRGQLSELELALPADVGLPAALEQECASFRRRTDCSCEGRFEGIDVDPERSALVVLIAREALCNIARHSHATNAVVSLQEAGDCVILTVGDNGCGMEPSRIPALQTSVYGGCKSGLGPWAAI